MTDQVHADSKFTTGVSVDGEKSARRDLHLAPHAKSAAQVVPVLAALSLHPSPAPHASGTALSVSATALSVSAVGSLKALETRSPPPAEAAKNGVKTTESLSAVDCTDVERHCGVTLATIHAKDGSSHLYLIYGVFFQELLPIDPMSLIEAKLPYHRPDVDFAFCIYSADEFLRDVCEVGSGNLYWPRTDRFYSIPAWYINRIKNPLKDLRKTDEPIHRPPTPSLT